MESRSPGAQRHRRISQASILFGFASLLCGPMLHGDEKNPSANAVDHPLADVLRYVEAHHEYIRRNIRDYTCRIVKRERIEGELQAYRFMDAKVRPNVRREERVVKPFSVFMRFLAPAELVGRRVLYVEGQNDNKMLVRKGGRRFGYVTVQVELDSELARRESEMSVVDIGFDRMASEIVRLLKNDMCADPSGENTRVELLRDAKVKDRTSTHVRVTHPRKGTGLEFHRASVYVDDEWRLPVRLEVYDWPAAEGEQPPLQGEFTYLNVKINVGLTDADFDPENLGMTQ